MARHVILLAFGVVVASGRGETGISRTQVQPRGYFYLASAGGTLGYHMGDKTVMGAGVRFTPLGLRFSLVEGAVFVTPRFGIGIKLTEWAPEFPIDFWEHDTYGAFVALQVLYRVVPESRAFHLLRLHVSPGWSAGNGPGMPAAAGMQAVALDYTLVPAPPFPLEVSTRASLSRSPVFYSESGGAWTMIGYSKGIEVSVGIQVGLGVWVVRRTP